MQRFLNASSRLYPRRRHRRNDTLEKVYGGASKGRQQKEKQKTGAEVLVVLPSPVFLDDELGGYSDDDVEPIPLMDKDHKEALLDNEDGEDEEDNVEEVAEGGARDELSSDEGGESSAESIEF